MIRGYCDQLSAFPGETIDLRIATDAAELAVHIYRHGATLEGPLLSTSWIKGSGFRGEDHQPSDDWGAPGKRPDGEPTAGWNALSLTLPGDWSSGVYLAIFVEGDGSGGPPPVPSAPSAYAPSGQALIVLKNPWPGFESQVLFKLPLFTYQAYNEAGGNSIYTNGGNFDVSLHRPGGGTGGTPWDAWNYDPYDRDTPRQVFAHWDGKLIAWLEGLGYRIDYCTDWDLHQASAPALLAPYALVLSVGHDEYYTAAMRAHLEAYLAGGGNIAFLSGNTCWWRCEFADGEPLRMLGQARIHHWSDSEVGNPEDSLTGVSYRNGGEGDLERASVGYTLQRTEQWPFEGVGVTDGTVIGGDDGLVGYECDGAPYDRSAPRPVVPSFPPGVGTPPGFMILATAATDSFGGLGNKAATMGMYLASGTVFTAATTDWPRVAAGGDPRVGQITRNVMDRLGGNPKGLALLGNFGDVIACDGFYTPDDGFRHAIVGTRDGGVTEIFYHPDKGEGRARVAHQPGLIDLAGFWSDDDGYRHLITLTGDGEVWETFFHPSTGTGQALLATISGAIRVAGFYSPDDQFRHAIVATDSGELFELFYHPDKGQGRASLGSFPGLIDLGAFYSPDDRVRHVIVGQADGSVSEIYFSPAIGVETAPIGSVPGLNRVSAYYAADDAFFNRRAAVAGQDGRIHEIRYHPHFGIMRVVLFNEDLVDLGSFFSGDDGYRHSILAIDDGDVEELFFRP